MINFLKKYFNQFVIIFIVGILFFVNYKPGTYLTGWDSLQTELGPTLGIKRAFFAVWQEYQSFGLVGGMAHASDLIRSIFVWLTSFILPQNLVRYFFHFLMLTVGGLGMFKLLKSTGFDEDKKVFAFLGSLFYLLNLGTIQIFFLPFEPFSIFFGLLPWEIWIFLKVINQPDLKERKEDLLKFVLVNILATPQAYVQTLFLVYILILGCITLGTYLENKSFNGVKKASLLLILIVLINSFWIIPQIYFLKTSAKTVAQAKINQLSTENVFYQNFEKGTIPNFLKMEGFYYDRLGLNNQPLFAAWKNHFASFPINILSYLLPIIVLIGILQQTKYRKSFLIVYFLVAFTLLGATPPFLWINELIRKNDLINQIFRSPFTKFIIPYSLVASYFFSSGLYYIHTKFLKRLTLLNFSLAISIVLIIYSLPAFFGFYVSPEMKVTIPKDYFETMDYFKHVDTNKRIALLPDYTFWGWFFNNWGYNGSGFLWYGIKQPIVSRTFDPWSNKSESYYWEMKTAIETNDKDKFAKVLEKYDVDYLLLDHSIIPDSSFLKALADDQIEYLIKNSANINLVKHLPLIDIYKISRSNRSENFISNNMNLPNIAPTFGITSDDKAYQNLNTYQTYNKNYYTEYYPFLNFTSQTKIVDKNWTISENKNNFVIESKLDINTSKYKLIYPDSSYRATLNINNNIYEFEVNPSIQLNNNIIQVTIPKTLIKNYVLNDIKIQNCSIEKGTNSKIAQANSLFIKSENGANGCIGYDSSELAQQYSYIVKIDSQNIKGQGLSFFTVDQTNRQSYLEDRLINGTQYYVLAPKNPYGLGYSLNFQNISYENLTSENRIENLSTYLFPYEFIKNIKFIHSDSLTNTPSKSAFKAVKVNYFTYKVNILNGAGNILSLYQSFHPGWKAYSVTNNNFLNTYFPFLFGREINNHVLINNWANGWELNNLDSKSKVDDLKSIVIIFWPQYLEFIGFGLLLIAFIFLLKREYN